MNKKITYDRNQVTEKILHAFEKLAIPVGRTLGPGGQNVLLRNSASAPVITKDGVTVSSNIELADDDYNLIISIIKEAGDKTNRETGDGTTSATVLAHEVYKEGNKLLGLGYRPIELQREILTGVRKVIAELSLMAEKVDKTNSLDLLKKIANISMNGDSETADLVAEAINAVGLDGSISVRGSTNFQNKWYVEKGIRIEQGWISPAFKRDDNSDKITLENPYILITSHDLFNAAQLMALEGLLNPLIQQRKPILIISSGVGGEFLGNLIANSKTGRLICCPIRPPYFGVVRREFFRDLAALTGARVIDKDEGDELGAVKIEHLGSANSVEITVNETVIIGGKGSEKNISERVKFLRAQLDNKTYRDLDKVNERLAKLSGGIGIVELYCFSETEMVEKQFRVEDAAHACKAALLEGFLPGGGAALLRASTKSLDKTIPGEQILLKGCKNLIIKLANNADISGEIAIAEILKADPAMTIDFRTGKLVNAKESGILDPLKVIKSSLINGCSIAATLLTTGAIISESEEKKPVLEQYM